MRQYSVKQLPVRCLLRGTFVHSTGTLQHNCEVGQSFPKVSTRRSPDFADDAGNHFRACRTRPRRPTPTMGQMLGHGPGDRLGFPRVGIRTLRWVGTAKWISESPACQPGYLASQERAPCPGSSHRRHILHVSLLEPIIPMFRAPTIRQAPAMGGGLTGSAPQIF